MFASVATRQKPLAGNGMVKRTSVILAMGLLALPTLTSAEISTSETAIEKGSYVCTPAGFGKKSRCYAR